MNRTIIFYQPFSICGYQSGPASSCLRSEESGGEPPTDRNWRKKHASGVWRPTGLVAVHSFWKSFPTPQTGVLKQKKLHRTSHGHDWLIADLVIGELHKAHAYLTRQLVTDQLAAHSLQVPRDLLCLSEQRLVVSG